jgi:hypothetical protein
MPPGSWREFSALRGKTLDIGGDNMITATLTHEGALSLEVEPRDPIMALINACTPSAQ